MVDLRRRGLLAAVAAFVLAAPAAAHTPYRQWVVYRRRHLLIGCHRGDAEAYPLAKTLEAWLAAALPEARARTARAPDAARLASLFATDQLHLGLMRAFEAAAMRQGREPFAPYGAVPLRTLGQIGHHLLVAGPSFDPDHVALVMTALAAGDRTVRPALPTAADEAFLHPAAARWFGARGRG